MPSIVKEIWVDNRIQRIEETVDRKVDNMDEDALIEHVKTSLKDYYNNVASEEEIDEFLKVNEYLPF